MTSAGDLRHRVAFEVRTPEDDGYGNAEGAFVEQFVMAAKVQAKFGGETVTAARLSGEQPVTIVVRQCVQAKQITTDWRARDTRSGVIYNIRSVVDPDDRGRWLELLCQSGAAT
ncbi:MAG: head-tail adaptor protein [Rhizobium sp.]|nr:MAG: head-tail adaptor protein [Rhizobium sp.]